VSQASRNLPVLIAGGGPVGLSLAIELGTRGVECLLVERGNGSVPVPKMTQLTTRTMEFCRRWGIADQVKAAAWPADHPGDFVYITSLTGYELFRQRVPSFNELRGQMRDVPYTPEPGRQCPQIFFDPILLRHARSLPAVTLRHHVELRSYEQDADGVEAELVDVQSGRSETVRAEYLVGCDGFDGCVRKSLGTEYDGSGVLSYSVSIYFRSAELPSLHDKGWARFYRIVDASGHWGDMIAVDGRELWRLTVLDADPAEDIRDFDVDACLRRAIGIDFPREVLSVLPWRRRELVAYRYRDRRVFIAGDAAHQSSPTGGLGMNTGVADAVDLGWKLAALREGWGGPVLLDSYEIERRPVAVGSVMASSRVYQETTSLPGGEAIAADSPEGELARKRFMEAFGGVRPVSEPISENVRLGYCYEDSPIICPDGTEPPQDGPTFIPSARPGTRAPHVWTAPGRSILDDFGGGYVLLRLGANPPETEKVVEAAKVRGVPLKVLDLTDAGVHQLYERQLVLVRPDGHVAWRADEPPVDADDLIARVTGAILTPARTSS